MLFLFIRKCSQCRRYSAWVSIFRCQVPNGSWCLSKARTERVIIDYMMQLNRHRVNQLKCIHTYGNSKEEKWKKDDDGIIDCRTAIDGCRKDGVISNIKILSFCASHSTCIMHSCGAPVAAIALCALNNPAIWASRTRTFANSVFLPGHMLHATLKTFCLRQTAIETNEKKYGMKWHLNGGGGGDGSDPLSATQNNSINWALHRSSSRSRVNATIIYDQNGASKRVRHLCANYVSNGCAQRNRRF